MMLNNWSERPVRVTREARRRRIVEQADRLFRRFGYLKTTVSDIANELGMSPANLYKFFPSKNAIIEATAEMNLSVLKTAIRSVVESGERGAMERIEAVTRAIAGFNQELLREEREIFKLMNLAQAENWNCCRDFDAFLLESIHSLLQEGMRSGEFRAADPEPLAKSVIDSLFLVMHPHLRWAADAVDHAERAVHQFRLVSQALQNPSHS